jgi:hypothetical protein
LRQFKKKKEEEEEEETVFITYSSNRSLIARRTEEFRPYAIELNRPCTK